MNNNTPEPHAYTGTPWAKPPTSSPPPERKRRLWLAIPAAVVVLGLGGFVFAQWLTTTLENQQVTAGTGPQISLTSRTGSISGDTVTFAALPGSEVQPSFVSAVEDAEYANASGSAVVNTSLAGSIGSPTGVANIALADSLSFCITDATYAGPGNYVLYNSSGVNLNSFSMSDPALSMTASGAKSSTEIDIQVGAGSQTTNCGNVGPGATTPSGGAVSSWPSLPASAAGGTFSWSLTAEFDA